MADTRLCPPRLVFYTFLCLIVFVVCLVPRPSWAIGEFRVDDDAHILTIEEKRMLRESYSGLGKYVDAAFSQILTCCEGGQVEAPMRHMTNFLMAMMLGVFVCFFVANVSRDKRGLAQSRIQAPSQR